MAYNDMNSEMAIRTLLGVSSCQWENIEFEDATTLVYSFGDYLDYEGDEFYYEIIYNIDAKLLSVWKIFDHDRIDMVLGNFSYSEICRKMRELA